MINLAAQIPLFGAGSATVLGFGGLWRRDRTAADYAFAAGMAVFAAEGVLNHCALQPGADPAQQILWLRDSMAVQALLPFPWLFFSLSFARGNAPEFRSRWRWPLLAALVLPVAVVWAGWSRLILISAAVGADGLHPVYLGGPSLALKVGVLVASIVLLMNLERTFLASTGTMRWRVKFMLTGLGLLFAVRLYTVTQDLLFRGPSPTLSNLNAAALLVALVPILRSFLRTGPRDLEVYPSHQVLQGSVSLLFAGVYLLVVATLAKGVGYLGGSNAFALQTLLTLVAVVLFVVLLQSDRLRLRLARLVSRHFARPAYDYRLVWQAFTEAGTAPLDRDAQCRALVKRVADVFQALSVALWMAEEGDLVLAASTSLSAAKARQLAPSREEAAMLEAHFRHEPGAADADAARGPWTAVVKRMQPSEFPRRMSRICLPLLADGRLAGLLLLGDRVGTSAFSAQDYDMLGCVGAHVTATLRHAQLSQRMVQAKEVEAFQTMAAFFVHDLKNAASTLSLTLRNLPVHFEDPEFRADALRGIGKSVDHINHLIARLGQLRKELVTKPADLDLNEMVVQAVAGLESPPEFVVHRRLSPLPRLRLDGEQVAKVVTNLVLNGKEAQAGRGEVELATRREHDWAVISVRDRGCGMTPAFIERSLYRPFQTTKKHGLGIGMFQSKMIVEVNGGRIAVASQPGEGTTFEVFFPLTGKP